MLFCSSMSIKQNNKSTGIQWRKGKESSACEDMDWGWERKVHHRAPQNNIRTGFFSATHQATNLGLPFAISLLHATCMDSAYLPLQLCLVLRLISLVSKWRRGRLRGQSHLHGPVSRGLDRFDDLLSTMAG